MGKRKRQSIRTGCLLFPFHSVSIPSPQSLWIMTEGLSLCWGAVGWRELLYPVELLKRLSFWVFHELWNLACHSAQQLHAPHTIPTIPCSHSADWTGQMEPILKPFSVSVFPDFQLFTVLSVFQVTIAKGEIHTLRKLHNVAHKVKYGNLKINGKEDLVGFQCSFDSNCWVSSISLWLSIKREFKIILVS